ncbi:Mor transcription activator family protein [Vreelandella venusta]|uniref:Mor transcription activator family protein n=1 Tax=Vreelandella venusta TaxID=44935 RepID=UPI003AA98E45
MTPPDSFDNHDNLDFGFDEIPDDALERLPDPELARHWPQSLVDMLQVIEAEYVSIGLKPRLAQRLAFSTLRILAYYHGGQVFYLAKGDQLDRALRDHQIWCEFNGSNHAELARRYDKNVIQIYKILAEQRSLHRNRIQPGLF